MPAQVRVLDTDVRLRWNAAWAAVAIGPTRLRLSAGTDRQLELDGLDPADVVAVAAWAAGGSKAGAGDSVVAHLVDLGVVALDVGNDSIVGRPVVRVETLDAAGEAVARSISELVGLIGDVASVDEPDDATDLRIVVRCGPGRASDDSTLPRLIVDVGADHTVVMGPFVVPGRSACEECLDRLIARRWEPVEQPPSPGVTEYAPLIAALVGRHVELIARGASPLVNHTIAFDLDSMIAQRHPLLMSPACTICRVSTPDPRPRLPWTTS